MKYGDQLVNESVPEWSLHNLDYNSLKHEIKVHTTRDQATAISIPGTGHHDAALRKFEDALYTELSHQHDRVGLFISSKADEISRRIDYLQRNIEKWIGKCPEEPTTRDNLRRQRRFTKYERELQQCGDDLRALVRFANAQVVAFRKIIKKYKKWTGSTTLGTRFTDNVLRDPASFTRRDFSSLRTKYEDVQTTLNHASPIFSEPSSPSTADEPGSRRPSVTFTELPPPHHQIDDFIREEEQTQSQTTYWNEYDNGSDTGGPEDDYAIYIDNDDSSFFPGLGYVQAVLGLPFEKAKHWFKAREDAEYKPLLGHSPRPDSGYASTTHAHTDSDEEGDASSTEFPSHGYVGLYALPSVGQQKHVRYRENVLFWGTIGGFLLSFILLGVAALLITTGRHKLRVEVDVGVTVGVVASLFCSCMALGMHMYRTGHVSTSLQVAVWGVFVTSCVLNGMLLILVVDNVP